MMIWNIDTGGVDLIFGSRKTSGGGRLAAEKKASALYPDNAQSGCQQAALPRCKLRLKGSVSRRIESQLRLYLSL
jgi:hypothetical protein